MYNCINNNTFNKIESISSLKNTLELLNKTTEDYLFMCSLSADKIWFFSDFIRFSI